MAGTDPAQRAGDARRCRLRRRALRQLAGDRGPGLLRRRRQRTWGILEELIPALTGILNDAQSAALLQTFEQDLNRDQLKTLLKQVGRMGSDLFRAWIEERLQPAQTQKSAD